MAIFRESVHQVLSYCKVVEEQVLASVTNSTEVSAGFVNVGIDFLQDNGQFFGMQFFSKRLVAPRIILLFQLNALHFSVGFGELKSYVYNFVLRQLLIPRLALFSPHKMLRKNVPCLRCVFACKCFLQFSSKDTCIELSLEIPDTIKFCLQVRTIEIR